MGGYGSGSWQTPQRRTVAEAGHAIDVRALSRAGYVSPGSDTVAFRAQAAGEVASIILPVEWTVCNYGGARPWFTCPRCGRRSGILYGRLGSEGLACRVCRGLTYPTRRMTLADRLENRARKLYARAGTSPHAEYHHKPRRMHWSTFNRYVDLAEAYDTWAVNLSMTPWMRRLPAAKWPWSSREIRAAAAEDLANLRHLKTGREADAPHDPRQCPQPYALGVHARQPIRMKLGTLGRWRFQKRKPLPLALRNFVQAFRRAYLEIQADREAEAADELRTKLAAPTV